MVAALSSPLQLIDLDSEQVRSIKLPEGSSARGTSSARFVDDDRVLVSMSVETSAGAQALAALHLLRVSDGSSEIVGMLPTDAVLVRGLDRSLFAYASGRTLGAYDVIGHQVTQISLSDDITSVAIARDDAESSVAGAEALRRFDWRLKSLSGVG